jgi:hypothetical protein
LSIRISIGKTTCGIAQFFNLAVKGWGKGGRRHAQQRSAALTGIEAIIWTEQ